LVCRRDIGRTLLLRVADIMRTGDRLAAVPSGSPVREGILAMTAARAGSVAILDGEGCVLGIFTDGDLRRHLINGDDLHALVLDEVMTPDPVTVREDDLAVDVLSLFEQHRIDDLLVLDRDGRLAGLVDIQDLPRLKIL
jgi:Predicted signal-transduction protein containing cAMP-binding and CBS domains